MVEGDPAAPYTDATRARLEVAFAAYELADLARAAVPIGEHELSPDGTGRSAGATLADAAHVLGAARRFFEAAAVFERMAGADWELVGDTLGVSARAARDRFAVAEVCFREGANGPRGETSWWRAHLAEQPLEAARDLDDWVLRHRDGDGDLGTTPVSGGLVRRVNTGG
ncbi:hypothetical protein [Streptomyces sp. IB2014 016-6]|uniref:hypothetical protein n=1 Tax=Streptomyces sp. IB2014 016-6 TaxID=2517818 RepID=UPI0011C7BDBB|nr:hypothetical protein [Streptomyces sp. IB2014 016-6]TXL89806.1 hypothetical protein EW053_12290 [Streptomyces sp. IB2014 016-6]